jgi:hypothetical protein
LTAGLVLASATAARAADVAKKAAPGTATTEEVKKTEAPPTGFLNKFLTPRMTSTLSGDITAANAFIDPRENPWTRDDRAVTRIERNALSAAKNAVKQYMLESMRVEAWSVPLYNAGGSKLGTVGSEDSRARLRFGISHLTPRAELSIPSGRGNASFSFNARGAMGVSFDSKASNFALGVAVDPRDRTASFTLNRRF